MIRQMDLEEHIGGIPEHELYNALIASAIHDYNLINNPQEQNNAAIWLFGTPDEDTIITFEQACEVLDLDIQKIRRIVLETHEQISNANIHKMQEKIAKFIREESGINQEQLFG